MDEVIVCNTCKMEFHQSFLAGHVEAFHVEPRKEDVVMLSCLSCAFAVTALHKNSMVHHCFVTGHDINSVEAQFNSYLVSERDRIGQILNAGLSILIGNYQAPATKTDLKREEISPKKAQRKRPAKTLIQPEKPKQNEKKPELKKIRKQDPSPVKHSELGTDFNKQEDDVQKAKAQTGEVIECTKCSKSITIDKNGLFKAIGHVLSHLPNLKLFRCRLCGFLCNRKCNLRVHYKVQHENEKVTSEDSLGTKEDAETIRKSLRIAFPLMQFNQNANLLTYLP